MFFDPLYLLILAPTMILALWAQFRVKRAFSEFSQVPVSTGLTGAEAAARMLRQAGLHQVRIEEAHGFLSDHYDPSSRVLRLSPDVYEARTVAAVGVACHEAGHAIQHAQDYTALKVRTAIVPMASLGSWLAWPMIAFGMALGIMQLAWAGVIAFSAIVVFQLITLPVELDASNRAKAQVLNMGLVGSPEEARGVSRVLDAAALTYVAATITALGQLLYFLIRLGVFNRRDD